MHRRTFILMLSALFVAGLPLLVLAQGGGNCVSKPGEEYCLLAPLPQFGESIIAEQTSLGEYLNTIYQSGVGLAIALAVVALIIGGLQYMTSESMGGKSGGRERITAAIVGLLLALGSFVLITFISGSGALSLDFSVAATNPAPPVPPPAETFPDPSSGNVCSARLALTETVGRSRANIDGIPRCPKGVTYWDELGSALTRVIDINLSEEELLDYFERGGDALSNQCYIRTDAGSTLTFGNINMSQCEATGLLEPGEPLACFEEQLKRSPTVSEKQYFCGNTDIGADESGAAFDNNAYYQIEFVADNLTEERETPGSCFILDATKDVEPSIAEACSSIAGGKLVWDPSTNAAYEFGNYYCVTEIQGEGAQNICQEQAQSPYPALAEANLRDDDWDYGFCNVDNIELPSGVSAVDAERLKNDFIGDGRGGLYNDLLQSLGLASYSGQTSGYYADEAYYNNKDAGGGTHWHTGLDIGVGGAGSVVPIKTPISGECRILRQDFETHPNNDKVAIIDPDTGYAWAFTHVDNIQCSNGDDSIQAGDVIAYSSANPVWINTEGETFNGTSHLHLEIYEDTSQIFPTNDKRNWSESQMTSGRHPDPSTIASETMCPYQAYFEAVESGDISI